MVFDGEYIQDAEEVYDMKKLFQAIRKSDIDTVKQLLEKKPELIFCTAKQPPQKDDGQSPLQVSLKTGNFEIANHLLDLRADVNAKDSHGLSCLWRFCGEARQILPTYNHVEQRLLENMIYHEYIAFYSKMEWI